MSSDVPKFDPALVVNPFVDFFKNVVQDPSNAQLKSFVESLVEDAAKTAQLYASNADPALIEDAKASLDARAKTIAAIPGLISARESDNFLATVQKVFVGLIGFGLKVAFPL